MNKMATDKAKTVFFETVTAFNKIQMPDSKNFVKFDGTISASLDEVPILNETLRHVVPPQVRKMQAELNQQLQNLIDQQFKNVEKQEQEQKVFLG